MSTSFITHRSQDGSRAFAVLSLNVLHSITPEQARALHQLGIHSLSDLLHYDPIHRARLVEAVARHRIAHDFDLKTVLRDTAVDQSPEALLRESTEVIDGIGNDSAILLRNAFGVATVAELANFPAFVEAETLLRHQADSFSEPASAPDELIPLPMGAVVSTHRFNSFVRDQWIALPGLKISGNSKDFSNEPLSQAFMLIETGKLAVGYMLRQTQEWTNLGSHLGEVIHSLGLAPGESRNVAIVDWKRSLLARRSEDTTVTEQLNSLLVHTRALDEVTRAVAEEHQSGRTSTASATGVTAGSAVATGTLIGSIAGAIVGGTTGVSLDVSTLGLSLGAGTIGGTVAGSMVGGVAGGFAASLIFSGAAALGYIESDSKGDRTVGGELSQNIMDVTSQKSSAIRSLRSTIVVEDNQSEQVNATTFNVTNYNHAHALTIQYYELLQRYRVRLTADALEPFLIVPFRPFNFTIELVTAYWNILRTGIPETIRQPIDEMINETGLIIIPKPPLSANPAAILSLIQVELLFSNPRFDITPPPTFSIVYQRIGGRDDGNSDPTFTPFREGPGIFVAQAPSLHLKLEDIHGIRVKGEGVQSASTMTLKVRQAEIRVDSNIVLLPAVKLHDYELLAGTGRFDHVFEWEPKTQLEENEQDTINRYMKINRLLLYIEQRRYFFTRLLLAGIEPEQLSDILERLVLLLEADNAVVPLSDLIETIPIGFTSEGIVCRYRYDTQQARVFDASEQITLRRGSPASTRSTTNESLKPILLAKDSHQREQFMTRIDAVASFPEEIFGWFKNNRESLTRSREISLPTSGLFAEAVMGRSNSAEKIDLTRFINWQDMPIPNAAPAILPVDTGSRAQETPPLNVTNTEGVLNILPPTPLPDPTGLTNALLAVQNGNIFRDMSQAAVLGSILTNLAGVAERTAAASAQLSGDALAASLQSGTQLASKVADGVQSLAGDAFKSMTQLGGELNTPVPAPAPTQPTPTNVPPTPVPVPPTPSPVPPAPDPNPPTSILREVNILLRAFIPSEIWEAAPDLSDAGGIALQVLRFNGDKRSFSQDTQDTSRITIPLKLRIDQATMKAVELDATRAFFGEAEVYLASDTEDVPNQAEWFERKKPGVSPIAGMVGRLPTDGKNIKIEQRSEGDNLVISIGIAAKPQFPFLSSANTNFVGETKIPITVPGTGLKVDFPLKTILDTLIELVRTAGGGFDIDANFQITFSRRIDGEIQYQLSGLHDGFPAFELYVNGDAAYTFMPIADDAPQNLFPPAEVIIAEQIPADRQTRILRRI